MPHVKVKTRPMARDKPMAQEQSRSMVWLTDAQGFRDLTCRQHGNGFLIDLGFHLLTLAVQIAQSFG